MFFTLKNDFKLLKPVIYEMITIIEIFAILILAVFFTLFIPIVVVNLFYTKFNSKKATLSAILFVIIFYVSLITYSSYLASNTPQTDLSKQFTLIGSNIGELDIGMTRDFNFEQAHLLHSKIIKYNLTDPLGFLYEDIPQKGFNTKRSIQMVQTVNDNISNFKLVTKEGLKPTLLKIHQSLTLFEKKEELRNYVLNYLNPQSNNVSNILNVDVENRVPAIGKTYRELIIRIFDNESSDMCLIDLSYDVSTGISEIVNIVYTTSKYSFVKPSTVYLETFYSTPDNDWVFFYVIINLFSMIVLILSFPAIAIKRISKTTKLAPPLNHDL